MAIPAIILNSGQVLLTQNNSSVLGIYLDNSPFLFGNIADISAISDSYKAGQNVCFNPLDALAFRFDNEDYFLTTEDKIIFNEGISV